MGVSVLADDVVNQFALAPSLPVTSLAAMAVPLSHIVYLASTGSAVIPAEICACRLN